jgi:hypothetical protein
MATPQLRKSLINLIKQAEASNKNATGKTDPIRNNLNQQTIGYIVNPRVILREILRPESPFRVQLNLGELTAADLRNTARKISTDFWKELQSTAKQSKVKVFMSQGTKLPSEFNNNTGLAAAFDRSKKIIYFRGVGSDSHEAFRGNILAPTVERIQGRTDGLDPLRIYVSPDKTYEAALNQLKQETVSKAEAEGLDRKVDRSKIDQRYSRAKKAFFKKRGVTTPWEGVEIGHTFGAKATGVAGLLTEETTHDIAHNFKDIKLHPALQNKYPELFTFVKNVIRYDTELLWERVFRQDNLTGKVVLTIPESWINNKLTGGLVGAEGRKLNKFLQTIRNQIYQLEGSPSAEQLLVMLVKNAFLGKRTTNKTYRSKVKHTHTSESTTPIYTIPSAKVKVTDRSRKQPKKNIQYDLQSIIELVNNNLTAKIRQNMGKGESKQILNWRTGRFGESAKLLNLLPSKERRAIVADVKYHGRPYTRFEKGKEGDLWKPGRDPKRIFGRSIRQILQEQKLGNFRRVEVKLRRDN